jgi:serine/threonine protein kinase
VIAAGQSIGNYRILSKIGTGGMGAVYLAEHPLIGKKVALKVIHRDLANNREVVQRFFQEAKAVNKIGNEHIVEIHDFGITPENDHFYIMEYLEGRTLAHLLAADRRLDVMRALHVGAQIASALAAAHASGVIHRDLKPDNVMLTLRLGDPDFVKLLDFGLAKMFAAGSSAVKTAAGVLLGTPQFMSPEACESKPGIDHRTDIYALGILLFQMMTGQLPFDGESMGEVLVKQVTQLPPPPRALNPAIPPSVEQIVLRCLMKPPDARFPTMIALREALLDPERYLGTSPPIAPTRSLAPGTAPVDGKTVMQYAAAHGRTRVGVAEGPGAYPLPAPPSSAQGLAGVATMIAEGAPPAPARQPALRPVTHGPDLSQPAMPKTNTMRIATPLGYSSRPPRRAWPIVLLVGLLLGLGGGAFAVAWFGKSDGDSVGMGTAAAAPAQSSPTANPGPTSKPQPTPSPAPNPTPTPSPAPNPNPIATTTPNPTAPPNPTSPPNPTPPATLMTKTATVELDTDPSGAEVMGADKKSLGKTPLKLELPLSTTPVFFDLTLPGYRKKTKAVVVAGNTVIQVPLERVPAAQPLPRRQHPAGTNDLMVPE